MSIERHDPITLDELRAAIVHASDIGATSIADVPASLLGGLLAVLDAAESAATKLEAGKAAAARRQLNRALNHFLLCQ